MKSLFCEKEILLRVLRSVVVGVPHSLGYWNVNPNAGSLNVVHVTVAGASVGRFACGVPDVRYHKIPPAATMTTSTASWVAIFENPSLLFI